MKRIYILITAVLFFVCNTFSQENHALNDPSKEYSIAKEFFENKEYALAYPLLNELDHRFQNNHVEKEILIKHEVNYYFIVTSLFLKKDFASEEAKNFINDKTNLQRAGAMSYYLGHYFFINEKYSEALTYFASAGYNDLKNDEISELKFEQAYSYFFIKDYEKAKPLFNEIHQLPSSKYYLPAKYYYGFIVYREKDYETALKSFKLVEDLPEYKGIVPYYIAEIYYSQNNKTAALEYAEKGISSPNAFYKKDLQLLSGQIYFENKDYAKALPFLESYVNNTSKITKEVLYEISYCYYASNNINKAIEGFKQLNGNNDSLGQNSMYLLGDLYIQSGDKANARNSFQFSANNSSNKIQQEIAQFNFAKLSFELKYTDVALREIRKFIATYPNSKYITEAQEILVNLLANTNNFTEALSTYTSLEHPSSQLKKVYPKLLFGKATEYLNQQKTLEADSMFRMILSDANGKEVAPFANFWLGEIAFRNQHYDESIKYVNAYFKNPETQGEANVETANYLLGYSYFKKENYKAAINYFRQIINRISLASNFIEQDAFLRTGDSYFMTKDYSNAKNIYDNVIAAGLATSDYALYQNALIGGINNPNQKISVLSTLESKYPSSDLINDANLEIANSYMAEEKFKEAIPYLEKITRLTSNQLKPKAYLKLGLSYYNLNSNTEALTNYQKLVIDYPQSAESDLALENMKSIYVEKGKPEEYISILKKAGKVISITEADSLTFNAALLKFNTGDCNNAIAAFSGYLEQYATGAFVIPANYYRSECYFKNKDWKNAITGYELAANSAGNKLSEKALLQTARLYYLELEDYNKAKEYFNKLKLASSTPENQLEALRGLVRSYNKTKDFNEAGKFARELLSKKNISTDDRAIANLVLGKSLQLLKQYDDAIIAFKLVTAIDKSAWGSEAHYEMANCYLALNNLIMAEKTARDVIRINGSSENWITRSYILLGDIYTMQKDYFNAKAMYQSVADNATIKEIKEEAKQKLDKVTETEKLQSKLIP